MADWLPYLLAPLVMCWLLVGIHCYLGLHVLARGIVFVDLSLAQVAALGAVIGLVLDFEKNEWTNYLFALIFALLASVYLTVTNRLKNQVTQEATIGILYAFASAGVVLFLHQVKHGAEHLKHALVGQLLFVTWEDVIKTGSIYLVIAALHFLWRRPLAASSFHHRGHWIWNFIFYVLFSFVIVSSVQSAGVLLVFTFLIVPALLSSFRFQSLRSRLVFGWSFGFLLSAIGMGLSFVWDLPSGAFIVVLFTSVSLVWIGYEAIFRSRPKRNGHAHSGAHK